MKKYSKEQIRAVVQHELSVKLGKDYLKNFTTFLNQFPDPETIDEKPVNVRDQFVKPTNEWE
jgi:hypothetical protein